MPQRKFANQKALIDYAEQNGLVYVWGWIERQRVISPAFTKRKRLLSPDQYEIVDVLHISWCADGNAVSKGDPASGVCGQRSVKRGPGDPTRALAGEAGGEAKDNMKNGAASGGGSRPEGDTTHHAAEIFLQDVSSKCTLTHHSRAQQSVSTHRPKLFF